MINVTSLKYSLRLQSKDDQYCAAPYLFAEMRLCGGDHGKSIKWRGRRRELIVHWTIRCLRRYAGIVGNVVFPVPCTSPRTCSERDGNGKTLFCRTAPGSLEAMPRRLDGVGVVPCVWIDHRLSSIGSTKYREWLTVRCV